MNEDQFKEWIKMLPLLSVSQLEQTVKRIHILNIVPEKTHDGKSEFGLRLLQAICDVLRKNNAETPSMRVLRKSSAYVSSTQKIYDLSEFFDNISRSRLVQDQILRIGIDLLYHDLLQWQGIAISSHTLLQQVHRVPSVLNKHFPGYAASGMLTKLVKVQ